MALTTLEEAVDVASATSDGKVDLGRLDPRAALRRASAIGAEWLQRGFDLVLVLATLPLTLTAMIIAAALVYREDRGPVLFSQTRVGRGGRLFTIYKLRTMRHNAPGEGFTRVADPRITRIGAVLRRYRIDELPQIINILRGEMSIVGPRPEVSELAERYAKSIPHYMLRHYVRPGLTGWAQVRQGYAAGVDAVTEKLRYDLFYVVNRSLWMDIRILFLTIGTLARGQGAR